MSNRISLAVLKPTDMPLNRYLDRIFLAYLATAAWTLAVWDGTGWHDADSGVPLDPLVVLDLPVGTAVKRLVMAASALL